MQVPPPQTPPSMSAAPLNSFSLVTAAAVLAEAQALLDAGLPLGVAPVATFDADGTLWAGDVGEDLFAHFVRSQMVHSSVAPRLRAWLDALGIAPGASAAEGLLQFLHEYEAGRGHSVDAYEMMVWVMAGHSETDLATLCEARAEAYARPLIFPEMHMLLQKLPELGITPYIVSASNIYSVRGGARALGLPLEQVRAIRLEVQEDGVLSDRLVRPAPLDQGKVPVAQALAGGGRPLLGFGDSPYDLPMLSLVHRPFYINPSERVLIKAAEATPQYPFRRLSLSVPA